MFLFELGHTVLLPTKLYIKFRLIVGFISLTKPYIEKKYIIFSSYLVEFYKNQLLNLAIPEKNIPPCSLQFYWNYYFKYIDTIIDTRTQRVVFGNTFTVCVCEVYFK